MRLGLIHWLGPFIALAATPTILTAGSAYGRMLIECAAAVEVAQTTLSDGTTAPAISNRKAVVDGFKEQASNWDGSRFAKTYFEIAMADWQSRPKSTATEVAFAQRLEECSKYAPGFGYPFELID